MTKLEEKLINAYTVLVLAEEIELEDILQKDISTGKDLRKEVELEVARKITNTVPEPVDYKLVERVNATEMAVAGLMEMMLIPDMEIPEIEDEYTEGDDE